ncbi:MAG: hypothetical protein K9K88_04815 [Desulfobacterales bacterium]|nr:hypothetical protein [Desulfobacterales bacterium]
MNDPKLEREDIGFAEELAGLVGPEGDSGPLVRIRVKTGINGFRSIPLVVEGARRQHLEAVCILPFSGRGARIRRPP